MHVCFCIGHDLFYATTVGVAEGLAHKTLNIYYLIPLQKSLSIHDQGHSVH